MAFLQKNRLFLAVPLAVLLVLFLGYHITQPSIARFDSLFSGQRLQLQSKPTRNNRFRYVDPLIGSVNGGHVFPGATLPFGMAKASPDVTGENQGGFGSDGSDVMGFSGLHDLGVGWLPSLGNFPIMPITECPDDNPASCKFGEYVRQSRAVSYHQDSVIARPGYFAIGLSNGINADMTVTAHTALYRFRRDTSSTDSSFGTVVYVALEDLHSYSTERHIVVDPASGRVKGNGSFSPSFGEGSYSAHFCADFSGADVKEVGYVGRMNEDEAKIARIEGSKSADGSWLHFTPSAELLVRVGLSFISPEQACQNAETEIKDIDFESTLSAAEVAWEAKFDVVAVDADGVDEDMLTLFWTGIYRSFISPQDYTGENPLWDSDEPYYDSWYCIWDTFRTTHPLITLLDQQSQTRMVRSLIDIYVHEGRMPDCRMSFCKGYTQGGSNADVVLTDSYLKGISENIDWNLGLEACYADAKEPVANWLVQGRGGIDDWEILGYLAADNVTSHSRTISRTVEYAYDDFCIAELAHKLNDGDADQMLKRSYNWENLFNETTESWLPVAKTPGSTETSEENTGFVGFLQPRFMNGSFGYQDPAICSPLLDPNGCYLNYRTNGETYEGSVWLYTFLSQPGDFKSLISKLGGDQTFVERLDYFHDSGLLYFGDEQSFLTTYMYHYAGRPALSGQRVRFYIPSIFNTSLNGLPGNDDSGAMGAFTTLTMLGLFPNAGQDVYLIVPPFFRAVSILNQSTGKTATVKTKGFDGSHGQNTFIQSATLNGRVWNRSWLRHSFFLEGGTLELTLGSTESDWGTREEDRPPSSGRDGNWDFMTI